ncbi:MAG: NADH:ubiquinone oxidoreductase [Armatimonadetes bacterium]|nr:NADH:ubiquinone oxidoreductase [Armatimonadota bacterium]
MAWLCLESPDVVELLDLLDIEVLWHPSLSNQSARDHLALLGSIAANEQPLDILVVEGAVLRGPGGTGMFDTFDGRPKKDLIGELARRARHVVAAGTCASFGGASGEAEVEASGLQFVREEQGGFLGPAFRSGSGRPVVNLPGCPVHPQVLAGTLAALCQGEELALGPYQAPATWYGMLVHQGCVRNEYHEYRVEDADFGTRGCMFFHLGCRGPLAFGPCNKLLWNRRSSKTRVGVPCMGCTMPDFPRDHPLFDTPAMADIPLELPAGVDRAHYLAYKGMAAAAAPDRLLQRQTRL